jgi:hypothetical protein
VNPDQADQVLVLGMHRSGTSAIAGALAAMGLYAGSELELMDKTEDNPRGYFERKDVYLLTSAIFRDSGADWWKVSEFDPQDIPSDVVAHHGPKIRKLVDALDAEGSWLLKDPRLCLLFPLFRPWLREPLVIVAARHPVEVAKSLRKRDRIPLHAGIALWEFYVRKACRYARKERHLVVPHAELIHDPDPVVGRMAGWLEEQGVAGLDFDSGARWVDRSLHRQKLDDDEERMLLNDDQRQLWRHLASSRIDDVSEDVSDCTLQILKDFETDFSGRRQLERKLGELTSQVESIREQVPSKSPEAGEISKTDRSGAESSPASLLPSDGSLGIRILEAALGDCLETIWEAGLSTNSRGGFEGSEKSIDPSSSRSLAPTSGGSARWNGRQWRPDLSGLDWHSPMLVSVIVRVTESQPTDISACIDCLKSQSWPLWELIIVGDAAGGGEQPQALDECDVRVAYRQSRERGYWKAINQGLHRANGDLLTIWNADCRWHSDFLSASVMAFQQQPSRTVCAVAFENSEELPAAALPHPVRKMPPIWGMIWRRGLLGKVGELRVGSEAIVVADWLLRAANGQPFDLDSRLAPTAGESGAHVVTEEWWMNRLDKLSANDNRTA